MAYSEEEQRAMDKFKQEVSQADTNGLITTIAYFSWATRDEDNAREYFKRAWGLDYDSEIKKDVQELTNILWDEARKRGINTSQVNDRINQIASIKLEEAISNSQSNKDLKNIFSVLKTKRENQNKVLKGVLIAVIVIVVIYLIYKFWFKKININ